MTSILEQAGFLWREVAGRLTVRRDTAPIDDVNKLQDFVGTRSAYVAQKTLYGYVKTRMGTRYPRMFEDERLIASLNIAKMYIFAACLSDLTVYAVAIALHDKPIGNDERGKLAGRCYGAALRQNTGEAPEQFSAPRCADEFEQRLRETDWRACAPQPDNFTASPKALFRWAPIADELKKFDREIVQNSIKFSWRDVREEFHKRVNGDAIYADWLKHSAS